MSGATCALEGASLILGSLAFSRLQVWQTKSYQKNIKKKLKTGNFLNIRLTKILTRQEN
jgi:hypothetical protein